MSEPGETEQPSATKGVRGTLAVATVILSAVFVFGILPRVSAPPVVTTDLPAARTTPAPRPSPAGHAPTAAPATPGLDARPPAAPATGPFRAPAPPRAPDPADDAWSSAVSDGLSALDRGALPEAREAFARAEAARPGTGAVRDGLLRVAATEKDARLAEHRSRALRAEAAEDWSTAGNEYEAAQKLDPAVAFAVEGRPRATARRALDERLEGYLKRPDRLATEAVAREAEAALGRAAEVEPQGPRLARQIAALKASLAAAQTVVAVHLVSDGLTDVALLRVARLGVFKEKALQLRPGSYVVVGTRKGYRDTRVVFEVAADRPPAPVRVRCDETL